MPENGKDYWGMDLKTYCMMIHLSQLSSLVIPGLGFILPIVMWVVNKDQHEDIDNHGKATVNWLISALIYSVICFILMFVLIGFIGFAVLAVTNMVFAIIAAIKANNGELWQYPFSLKIMK